MRASLNWVTVSWWSSADSYQQRFGLVIVHTKHHSEYNSPQIKNPVLVLKPSCLQGGHGFNLKKQRGERKDMLPISADLFFGL